MTEILRCPFCGGKPRKSEGLNEHWISCMSCQASSIMRSNIDAAISAWNARAPAQGAPSDRTDLRRWLNKACESQGAKVVGGGFGNGVFETYIELDDRLVHLTIASTLTSTDRNLAVDRDSDRSATVPDQVKQQHAGSGGGMTTPDTSTECGGK